VVHDDLARESVELAIADVAAIAELGREDLQELIATRGLQRFRQPEYYFGELMVREVNRHGELPCATRGGAR